MTQNLDNTPPSPPTDMTEKPTKKPNSFLFDFGPLLIFFVAFQILKRTHADDAMIYAAGILGVTALFALAMSWLLYRHLSGMLIFTTALVVFFAGLTFFSGNKIFLFMKPTIVNVIFGLGVIGGIIFKKNIVKLLIGSAIDMQEDKWNSLAIRWGLFFFFCAIVNEIIWRNFSEDFWVKFKVFGFMPLTLLFTLTQIPFIQKHGKFKTEK